MSHWDSGSRVLYNKIATAARDGLTLNRTWISHKHMASKLLTCFWEVQMGLRRKIGVYFGLCDSDQPICLILPNLLLITLL